MDGGWGAPASASGRSLNARPICLRELEQIVVVQAGCPVMRANIILQLNFLGVRPKKNVYLWRRLRGPPRHDQTLGILPNSGAPQQRGHLLLVFYLASTQRAITHKRPAGRHAVRLGRAERQRERIDGDREDVGLVGSGGLHGGGAHRLRSFHDRANADGRADGDFIGRHSPITTLPRAAAEQVSVSVETRKEGAGCRKRTDRTMTKMCPAEITQHTPVGGPHHSPGILPGTYVSSGEQAGESALLERGA